MHLIPGFPPEVVTQLEVDEAVAVGGTGNITYIVPIFDAEIDLGEKVGFILIGGGKLESQDFFHHSQRKFGERNLYGLNGDIALPVAAVFDREAGI